MDGLVIELILTGWLLLTGTASQYDPGVFEIVITNRQARRTEFNLPAVLPQTDGFIAVENCEDIGQIWYIQSPTGRWESFLVADCAGPQLRPDGLTAAEWMRNNNIVVEVDGATAERWDTVGAGIGVQVIRRIMVHD